MEHARTDALRPALLRVALVTAAILVLPALAMRFTPEVRWGLEDFAAAALLLSGTGCAWVLASRRLTRPRQRAGAALALLAGLLAVWAELAVGILPRT